jgi:hypothetical protein
MKGTKKFLTRDDLLAKPLQEGFVCGLLEVVYIFLVGLFILGTETLFAGPKPWLMILGIVAFLILTVLSVAITVVLIFNKPLYYFFEKKYKDSCLAFSGVVGALFLTFMIIFLLAALVSLF